MKIWRKHTPELWEARITCRVFKRSDGTFVSAVYFDPPNDKGSTTEFLESGHETAWDASDACRRMVRRFIQRAHSLRSGRS